ncbi:MAG: hypothetical protein JWP82_1930, partial [Humibacillus sp.]|nr:hypothetical protein [Humibacillus sp.]
MALAPAAATSVCADAAWPATVGNLARVDTDPVSGSVAAWGDP